MSDSPRDAASPQPPARRSFGLWLETVPAGPLTAIAIPFMFLLFEGLRITSGAPLPLIPRGPLGDVYLAGLSIVFGSLAPRYRAALQARRPMGQIRIDVWRAVADSRLPDGADLAVWRPAVEWYASEYRRANASNAKLIGALAFFPVVALIVFPHGSLGWILLVVCIVLGILILRQRRRLPPRLDALFAQLAEREGRRADSID